MIFNILPSSLIMRRKDCNRNPAKSWSIRLQSMERYPLANVLYPLRGSPRDRMVTIIKETKIEAISTNSEIIQYINEHCETTNDQYIGRIH